VLENDVWHGQAWYLTRGCSVALRWLNESQLIVQLEVVVLDVLVSAVRNEVSVSEYGSLR
jgi:hypothetical protein